jgi:hypothetical protein
MVHLGNVLHIQEERIGHGINCGVFNFSDWMGSHAHINSANAKAAWRSVGRICRTAREIRIATKIKSSGLNFSRSTLLD